VPGAVAVGGREQQRQLFLQCRRHRAALAPATSSHGSDNSSISEYLTKTLLGWHVKDFLVDEATAAAAATNIGVSADASSYQVGVGVGHLVSWPLFVRYPDPHGPIAMVN
jgi:hypothetical protein